MIDYSSLLSMKVQEIKPSGIRKFSELAAAMGNVISLGVGGTGFPDSLGDPASRH